MRKQEVKKRPEIAFPPKLCSSGDRSASLCHISLRRSSQRLAGCVWPGLTLGEGVWVPGPEPSGPQPPSRLPHTSLASHWGQVREPLGRGASTSRTAPFKPLGGGGGDPSWLQLSEKRAEDRGRRWSGKKREEPARREDGWQEVVGVSYPGRRMSSGFMVWNAAAEWKLDLLLCMFENSRDRKYL